MMEDFNCKKCGGGFPTRGKREAHIVDCDSILFADASAQIDQMGLTLIRLLDSDDNSRGVVALCASACSDGVKVVLLMKIYGEWGPRGGQHIVLTESDLLALSKIKLGGD